MKISIYFSILLILFFSCQKEEKCKYGEPQAIFTDSLTEFHKHRFILRNKVGIESVSFKDGVEMTIYQSGCDYVKQDFEFEMSSPPDSISNEYWIQLAVDRFRTLGQIDSAYYAFSSWAQAIDSKATEMKLAEVTEVQPGFYAKIDAIRGKQKSTLLVTLSERP